MVNVPAIGYIHVWIIILFVPKNEEPFLFYPMKLSKKRVGNFDLNFSDFLKPLML
jgi:hypothetical protein